MKNAVAPFVSHIFLKNFPFKFGCCFVSVGLPTWSNSHGGSDTGTAYHTRTGPYASRNVWEPLLRIERVTMMDGHKNATLSHTSLYRDSFILNLK